MAESQPQVSQNTEGGDGEEEVGSDERKGANVEARARQRQQGGVSRDDSSVGDGKEGGSSDNSLSKNKAKSVLSHHASDVKPEVHLENPGQKHPQRKKETHQNKLAKTHDNSDKERINDLPAQHNLNITERTAEAVDVPFVVAKDDVLDDKKGDINRRRPHSKSAPNSTATGDERRFQAELKTSLKEADLEAQLGSKENNIRIEQDTHHKYQTNKGQMDMAVKGKDEGIKKRYSPEMPELPQNDRNDIRDNSNSLLSKTPEHINKGLKHVSLLSARPQVHTSARQRDKTQSGSKGQHFSQSINIPARSATHAQVDAHPKALSRSVFARPEKAEQQLLGLFTGMFAYQEYLDTPEYGDNTDGVEESSRDHINLQVKYITFEYDETEEPKRPTKKHRFVQHCGSCEDITKWTSVLESDDCLKEINAHFRQFGNAILSLEDGGTLKVGLVSSADHAQHIGLTAIRYVLKDYRTKIEAADQEFDSDSTKSKSEYAEHDRLLNTLDDVEQIEQDIGEEILVLPHIVLKFQSCIEVEVKDLKVHITMKAAAEKKCTICIRGFRDNTGTAWVRILRISDNIKSRQVNLSEAKKNILSQVRVEEDVDNLLKHTNCVSEQLENTLIVHGLNLNEIQTSCKLVKENFVSRSSLLTGQSKLYKDDILKHVEKKAHGKASVSTDESYRIQIIGLKYVVSLCTQEIDNLIKTYEQVNDGTAQQFKKLGNDLHEREVSISTLASQCLIKLRLEHDLNAILKQNTLDCFVRQQEKKVFVLGIDDNSVQRACAVVSRNIVEYSHDLIGKSRDHAAHIKAILEEIGKGKVVVEVDTSFKVRIIGLANFADSCLNGLKARLTNSTTDFVNKDNFSSSTQSTTISERKTQIENQAKQNLLTCQPGKDFISGIEKRFDVRVSLDLKKPKSKGAPRKQGNNGKFHWTLGNKKTLVLECCRLEKTRADLKILTRTHAEGRKQIGKAREDGSNTYVDVGIKDFDKRNEQNSLSDLRYIVSEVLTKVKEIEMDFRSVAVPLQSFNLWEYTLFSGAVIESCIHSLEGLQKDDDPDVIVLCAEDKAHFQQAERFIEEYFVQKTSVTKAVVVEGELDKTEADVIVNTTSHKLDLNTGRVSKALLRAAGADLQKECHTQFPNGIGNRGIALTRGHGLPCQYVIHVALSPFKQVDEQERLEDVRSVMQQCLARASELELKTIAIPAFGTGNLKYPPTLVAGEMFSSVERFAQDTKKTTLKKVMFVVFPRDTDVVQIYKRIEREFYDACEKRKSNPVHTLTVCGSSETAVDEAHRRLNVYLDNGNNGQKEEQVVMNANEYAAIKKIFQGEFFAIDKIFVKCNYETPNGILYITGNPGDVNNAVRIVHQCHEKLNKMQKFCVPNQNRNEHLKDRELDGVYCVKDRFQDIVHIYAETEEIMSKVKSFLGKSDKSPKAHKDHRSELQNRPFSWTTDAKNVTGFSMNKLTVKSYEADILLVPVDCIVNAANKDLQHGGGIAQVIASAAGSQLIDECRTIIRKARKALVAGDVVATEGGNLRYRTVLHAVGPCWNEYDTTQESEVQRCVSDLRKTILNCLIKAEEQSVKSIAFPSISSGLFGVPHEICAKTYANAVHQFSKSPRALEEIHFVDISHDMTKAIQDVLKEVTVKGHEVAINTKNYQNTSNTNEVTKLTGRGKTPRPKKCCLSALETFYLDDNIIIIVQIGDITMLQEVNAIVCSDSGHGKNVGIIAQKLYERGGTDYQKEKNEKFETWKKVSEVVGTAGGDTDFKHILHAVVPQKDLPSLKKTYRNVFKMAKSLKVESIAIPLLGTGQGGILVRDSVTSLLSELQVFVKKNINYGLTVHIVIYENNTLAVDVVEHVRMFVNDSSNTDNPGAEAIDQYFQSDKEKTRTSNEGKDTGTRPKAKKLKVVSIAFPLLGTGRGAYTVDISLTALLTQLEQFCKQKNKYLKEIHIVIKEQTLATRLAEQVQTYIENKAVNEPSKDANLKTSRGTRTEPEKLEEKQPQIKLACPTCGMVCGVISGDQPSGTMDIQKQLTHIAGYNDCGSISVGYRFPDGHQGANHPRPGSFYAGINRVAYLPDNDEGRRVCGMLAVAFQRRLVFTIVLGQNLDRLQKWKSDRTMTFNPSKKEVIRNKEFGYPDPTYLQRVAEELAVKGVTVSDITPDMAKFLKDKTPGARKQISTK
ncbi:PAR14-like protein [Mya arenaria]|uniref:PAR14-like protein n=1 Tax=Mya arenaria TaxID=6604 RepID=A0ABY7FJY3_MYAAR|nr:PAR14-like protein [Mya arenaria]